MFQPFEKFKLQYVEGLIKLNKRYLVTQTYGRAYDHFVDEHKIDLLLSDYEDLGQANIHLNAIRHDKLAAIIDLQNHVHKSKLLDMLGAGSKYNLYWAIVKSAKEVEERMNKKYIDSIRRYITQKTNWRIGSGEAIRPTLQVTFGELFIILKYKSQTVRVKFVEIENI